MTPLSDTELAYVLAAQHALSGYQILCRHGGNFRSPSRSVTALDDLMDAAVATLTKLFGASDATRLVDATIGSDESLLWHINESRETGLCTCCVPPRAMSRWSENHEWEHDDDETYAEVAHVHVDLISRDCDGTYRHHHTTRIASLTFDQPHPDASDLWRKMARAHAPLDLAGDDHGEIHVEAGRIHWSCTSDEGGASGELRLCHDAHCAHDQSESRDLTAERAGY